MVHIVMAGDLKKKRQDGRRKAQNYKWKIYQLKHKQLCWNKRFECSCRMEEHYIRTSPVQIMLCVYITTWKSFMFFSKWLRVIFYSIIVFKARNNHVSVNHQHADNNSVSGCFPSGSFSVAVNRLLQTGADVWHLENFPRVEKSNLVSGIITSPLSRNAWVRPAMYMRSFSVYSKMLEILYQRVKASTASFSVFCWGSSMELGTPMEE